MRRCGKLLVARGAAQSAKLRQIAAQAATNGVHDLQALSDAEAHLFGIESPGVTACLAIADEVASCLSTKAA